MALISVFIASILGTAFARTLDTQLANHGYAGWSHYTVNNPGLDRCDTEAECRFDADDGTGYLGPITEDDGGAHMYARVIECEQDSSLSVSYQLASCVSSGSFGSKDLTFANLPGYGYRGARVPISGTSALSGLSTADLTHLQGECSGTWQTQSYSSVLGDVKGGCLQQLEIKNKLVVGSDTKHLFVYDVDVTCTPKTVSVSCAASGGAYTSLLHGFCVSGMNSDADGYYEMKTLSNDEETADQSSGYYVFVGDAEIDASPIYMYELNNQWVFGDDYTSSSTANLYGACQGTNGDDAGRVDYTLPCTLMTAPSGTVIVGAAMTTGPCPEHVVANMPSLMNFLETALGSQQYVDIAMLTVLCLLCCILGMVTCYGCQWVCYNCCRNRKYRQVASKEVDDIDF